MSCPTFIEGAPTPNRADTKWAILQKILCSTNNGGTSTSKANQYRGIDSPEGVVTGNATPPDTYWDELNLVLYIKNSGQGTNTGWQAH